MELPESAKEEIRAASVSAAQAAVAAPPAAPPTLGGGDAGAGAASVCARSHSARHGLLWGPLRLPPAMGAARELLSVCGWAWKVVLL